ncbi:MAG TPA: hypothetical protein VD963_07060 [Phycisphaerales bacterium]|nr:hypothetical protein [Phycisphaerales bacterium]
MAHSYKALCNDFYVNQRINLKMDLPMRRDTVLAMFDRVRRENPWMDKFRRYNNELALESTAGRDHIQQWLGLRKTSIRSGSVNPESLSEAYQLHRLVLEIAPYFLDISPLDLDYVELLYGFDLLAAGNHDAIVYEALIAGSPLATLLDVENAVPIDCQPLFGICLDDACELQAHFEIKTRTSTRNVRSGDFREHPISVYLTVRRYGPVSDVKVLPEVLNQIRRVGEDLLDSRAIPNLLMPIRNALAS